MITEVVLINVTILHGWLVPKVHRMCCYSILLALAKYSIFTNVGLYHICVVVSYHSYSYFLLPTSKILFHGWISWARICTPSASHRVVPLLQPFVHVGGTRCATFFDWMGWEINPDDEPHRETTETTKPVKEHQFAEIVYCRVDPATTLRE